VTAESDVPCLTWTGLAALGWDWSGPFSIELDGEPLHAETILRHLPGRRVAVRARWRGETVFAKLFFAGHGDEARRESACQRALVDAGVPTPAIRFEAAYCDGVVLVSDWITGRSGQAALRGDGLVLADQLLDCLFRLYAAGQRQLDLHLDNFLYDGSRFFVIDAGAVAPLPGGLRYEPAILDNLALFCAQAPLDLRDRLQEQVAVRLRQEGLRSEPLAAMVRRRSDRRLRSAMKKWRRESSAIGVWHEQQEQWLYRRSLNREDFEALSAWLRDPESLALIKAGSRVSVYGNDQWIVKHYRESGPKTRLRRALFKTRADISWVMGWTWALLGVPTPRPAMLRRCADGEAVIAFPRLEGTLALSTLMEEQRERARRVAPHVELWLKRLGETGFWHGDAKAQNILVDGQDRVHFIDLDGAGFSRSMWRRSLSGKRDRRRFQLNWEQFSDLMSGPPRPPE
jgi:tRNA A-37 threonylcarbamoyl transferase component Bud32